MAGNTAIYVHIPFCKKRCSYCTFFSSCDYSLAESYFSALNTQFLEYSHKYANRTIDTIYIGGGTPSSVENRYIDQLFKTIYSNFNIASNAEITVECNPESLTYEKATCLKANNVNRTSIGLQSTNDQTLQKIGRLHNYKHFLNALDNVLDAGISNISVDLIIGLPEQYEYFLNSIESVAKLPITHISMYGLEIHKSTQLFLDVMNKKVQTVHDADTLADWYDEGRVTLAKYGFDRYEISNFCKKGFESRHNLHYWQCDEYFGFGASAHGYLDSTRFENASSIADFVNNQQVINLQPLTQKDKMDEYTMLSLRLEKGLSTNSFFRKFNADFFQQYPTAKQLIQQGFLVENDGNVSVASDKFYVLSGILTELL